MTDKIDTSTASICSPPAGARNETTPRGKVIRAHTPRPARLRLHPMQVALRAMMERADD